MNCDSEPTQPSFFPTSSTNPIDFNNPPDATSAGLGEVVIPPGCTLMASGTIDVGNFPFYTLQRIWARIGSGAEVEGVVTGTSWSVSGIPNAHWSSAGLIQTVTARGQFLNTSTGGVEIISENRDFVARSGDLGCQYSSFETAIGSLPIQEAMPRYFRVSAEFAGQQAFGLMAGGLLSLGTLYLAYDSKVSTPECAVWRDIGLPPSVGGWLLRVVRIGTCCYEARLSIQSTTETCVLPATILLTRSWSFRKRNLLHGSLEIGMSKSAVTLIVEPS